MVINLFPRIFGRGWRFLFLSGLWCCFYGGCVFAKYVLPPILWVVEMNCYHPL